MLNKFKYIALPIFILLTSCQRSDIILSATDELHMLFLYETNNEFEISYISSSFYGTYKISNDTIYLTYYTNENNQSNLLNHRLLINREKHKIYSLEDEQQFCAYGSIDIRFDKKQSQFSSNQ
jgi:hypothetical protein